LKVERGDIARKRLAAGVAVPSVVPDSRGERDTGVKLKRDVLEITLKILCVSAVRCPSKRKKVHIWPDGEQLMTKTEIELLKELGYSPMQIFNLTDEEVKKILANAALDVADHTNPEQSDLRKAVLFIRSQNRKD
jgi:hypothetical protein